MYTVDLLNGEGVPIRSRPGGIAFACLLIVVPLVVGIVIVGVYLDRQVTVSIQTQQLARLQGVLGTLSAALEKKRSLEEQQVAATGFLADIKTALNRHTQWSPALKTVIDSLPNALVLTKLEARQEFVPRKVPSKGNPKTTVDVSVPVRTLGIGVCGYDGNASYRAVRDLQDRLRSSATLGPRLDAVTVSQESGTLDGEDVVRYELTCVFKPEYD
jgi:Tfp pilus assembly protein PilN